MSKPIPRKKSKAPVAKAKKKEKRIAEIEELMSPKAQRKMERKVKDRLDEISEKAETRFQTAKTIYDQQPKDVQEAVDAMVKTMKHMANPPKFTMDGVTYNVDETLLNSIQRKTHTWFAMRLLVACAEWGIRIGNFKAPKGTCLRCGEPVKKVKPKKKAKR